MVLLAALLMTAAPVVSPPPRITVSVRVSVEVLRAVPISAQPQPGEVERRIRATAHGALVEFT